MVAGIAAVLCGCAKGPAGGGAMVPSRVLDVDIRTAGAISNAFFYFFAMDIDNDAGGVDGPVPVAGGPFIANGWGTGSITHFLEYNLGIYQVFKVVLSVKLQQAGGGITGVIGAPEKSTVGTYEITVTGLTLGAATVNTLSGPGALLSAANASDQNAGTITLTTDATGRTVGGTVYFVQASPGGRPLNASEQAQISALNAGGVLLQPTSLSAFGLTLTLAPGPDLSGTQEIVVAQATGGASATFTDFASGTTTPLAPGLVRANETNPAGLVVPGLQLVVGTIAPGEQAVVEATFSDSAQFIDFPYSDVDPAGGNRLRATIDLDQIVPTGIETINFNIITTDELLLDPNYPGPHFYDGLGLTGREFVTISINQDRVYTNADSVAPEGSGDTTTGGIDAIDIVDWTVQVRFLR
jgi:hypothetical protein